MNYNIHEIENDLINDKKQKAKIFDNYFCLRNKRALSNSQRHSLF